MQALQKGPKACTTCAKAKARCIPGPEEYDKCERCERLNKECHSRPPAPPRIKKRPKRSRVAELEKRLNELSSQVGNAHQKVASPDSSNAAPDGACTKTEPLDMSHLFPHAHSPQEYADAVESPSEWTTDKYGKLESLWPMPDEATFLLAVFHATFEEVFPFIIVSKELTSEQLRDRRPYLWKAIMMVSVLFDGPTQMKLGKELLSEITTAAMVEGVKTLDLLQSLQLLIGWFHYALKGTQLTHLLFLARSMCVNLSSIGCEPLPADCKYSDLDHLRAHAATYYLNTLVFTTNKKTDIFMNTAHLETCCRILENVQEYPSDEYLIKLVKIQQLAQNICATMAFDPQQQILQAPLTMVVQSFQQQVDQFRASLPDSLKENVVLLTHMSLAEVLLKDISMSDQHCGTPNMDITDRLQLLWSCVRSLQEFFRVRSSERDIDKPRFINLSASDLAYTIITGIKLLSVKLPGWNATEIGKELGMEKMIDWMVTDLGTVIERRKDTSGTAAHVAEDPLVRLWKLLNNAKELVELLLQRSAAATEGQLSPYLMTDLDESLWFELVAEGGGAWGINDDVSAMPVM